MTLERLNALPAGEAAAAFDRCCGSSLWVMQMVAGRPYASREALLARADSEWNALRRDHWLEAFAHHPRIGDLEALKRRFPSTARWAGEEQRGAAGASEDVLRALADGNRAYEERFGYIFIAFASGRSAETLLEMLRSRLANEPGAEILIAGQEHMRITRHRLEKLLEEDP